MKPQVSVLMPVKNTDSFLAETLTSIINQDFEDWELLAVDDGSTDQSATILSNFSKQDQRIKHLTNPGNGIIEALRHGFENANGLFINRMDSDDVMKPAKLNSMFKQLEENGQGFIAVGLVEYFSDGKLGEGYRKYADWLNNLTSNQNNFTEIYKECVIPSPCWMMHRDDLNLCGAFESDIYPEDYDLCFRMLEAGLKVSGVDQIIHLWRDYPTRTSRTNANYSDNRFLEIKIHYFLNLHYQSERTLVIWGAGKKGKAIARALIEKKIPFVWACNNEKKIGLEIYNQKLHDTSIIDSFDDPQIIILVANPTEQLHIQDSLQQSGKKPMKDYFFFC